MKSKDLQGFKYFKVLSGMLQTLHDAGCARDRAGNRLLHMDQYMTLLLMYMFNPVCSSLRAIHEASDLKKVQRVLKVPRASLGSLSEAARVFDSDLLIEIIGELSQRLKPITHDTRLDDLGEVLTLVDGTWLRTVPKVIRELFCDDKHRTIKAHVQFEVLKGVPVLATITEDTRDERAVLAENLESGRLYVMDRGYAKYSLLENIVNADSSFVCRIRDNAIINVIEERDLSPEAQNAGIVRDAIVDLGGPTPNGSLTRPVRLVAVKCTPHIKPYKIGRGGPQQGETILLATNRTDLSADVVAVIYKHRWKIETFFRFFKHVLGCRSLISDCDNGIELQTYAAIIACMLISLWTGRKATLKTYRMLCWYFSGWADDEELLAHIESLKSLDAAVANN